MTERDLLNMKKEIDEAKVTISKLEGSEQVLIDQLKKNWGCATVEEAKKKLNKLERDVEKQSDQIKQGLADIGEKYINE